MTAIRNFREFKEQFGARPTWARSYSSQFGSADAARLFDVPPWLVDPGRPVPSFARLRWAFRRVLPALVWGRQSAPLVRVPRVTATVHGVWEHELEHDTLIGLFWSREDAEARAAENPHGNLPGSFPDNRGSWTVEEHEIS